MAHQRINREQEYALYEVDARHSANGEESADARRAARYGKNVLAPLEHTGDRAHRRDTDISVHHVTGQSRNLLIENIILLLFLVGSIYGLYRLTIYLLNQA